VTLLLLIGAAIAGYLISLRIHPYTHCGRCGGGGNYGTVYRKTFSLCSACGGSGRRLRWGVRIGLAGKKGPDA
jgi:hypothetical protein